MKQHLANLPHLKQLERGDVLYVYLAASPHAISTVVEYLNERKLPEAKEEVRKIRRKVAKFLLIDGILYKKGFSTPLLKCISTQKA